MLHQLGDVIRDRYQIMQFLGMGGMGTTYAAKDLTTGTSVAVKVMSLHQLTNWKALELFEREAQVLENLNHSAIPNYLDHFQIDLPQDRLFYLVQELAEGESLAQLVQRGWRVTEADVKQIAIQILEILNYLHQLTPSVIHRDIKPQNIIRRSDGQLFLVDFGAVQAVYHNTQTWGSTVVGTFGYMPPEQFRGKAYAASDLYALGGTLLFLLTHRSPADLPQKRMKILFRDKVALSEGFADWLERMLEPEIEDRCQSAEEALQALQASSATALLRRPSTDLIRQHPPKRSQIRIQRSSDWLIIELPPARWKTSLDCISTGCVALFSSLPVLFWIYIFVNVALIPGVGFGSGMIVFLLLLCAIGLGLVARILTSAPASYIRLEIDRQRFQIDGFQIGFGNLSFRHQHRGYTRNIRQPTVSFFENSKTRHLFLWDGENKWVFGKYLTNPEREWLAAEILDFLTKLQE